MVFCCSFFMVSFIEIFLFLRERWDLLATDQCQVFEFPFQSHKHETCARPKKMLFCLTLRNNNNPGRSTPYNREL